MQATRKILSLAAISALALLTACGGGGGGSTSPSSSTNSDTTTNPNNTTPSNSTATPNGEYVVNEPRMKYALKTSVDTSTYAGGALTIYNALNADRLAVNSGALTQNSQLTTAAAAHLSYIAQNYSAAAVSHSETSGVSGFTGADPWARVTAAGYQYANSSDVTESIGWSSLDSPTFCINQLLNSVYHADKLLGSFRDVGIAYGQVAANVYVCVLELGTQTGQFGQLRDTGVLRAFPFGPRTFSHQFYPANESPNPMPDYAGTATAGTPIAVSMAAYGSVNSNGYVVTKFALKDINNNPVPARILAASGVTGPGLTADATLDPGSVVLVPLDPLMSNAGYSVEFVGTNGDVEYKKAWMFSTY
jgi:uncharacterized protein YkwD